MFAAFEVRPEWSGDGVTYDQICGASYFSYFWKLLGQRMVRCETVVRLDRLPPQNIPSFQKRGRGNVLSRQSRQLQASDASLKFK